ncbi:BTB/POZ domain-containing protein 6-A, partial [Pseudolycoriella hygida]
MDTQGESMPKRPKLEEVFWHKTNRFQSEVNERLYLDEETADTNFICGIGDEKECIPAHKCILSKSSPYFKAMFYGPHANEKSKDYSQWSPGALKDFLKLCYINQMTINSKNIIEVIKLAHESQMDKSLKLCGEIWAENMTTDDVCLAYHWAIHFGMVELKDFCERKISVYAEHVFKTQNFMCCDRKVLNHILDLETLQCEEKTVLQACLNWASEFCERNGKDANNMDNLKIYLEDSLHKIRYQSITNYEDIARLTTGLGNLRTDNFNSNPRSGRIIWKENSAVKFNLFNRLNLSQESVSSGVKFGVSLRSNRPVLLGGICFASSSSFGLCCDNGVTVSVEMKLHPTKTIHTETIQVQTNSEPYLDLSDSPIVIKPKLPYSIFLQSRSHRNWCFSKFENDIKLDERTTIQLEEYCDGFIRELVFNLF